MRKTISIAALTAVCLGGAPVFAEDFPDRPIHLTVPFGQGGGSANSARAMARTIEDNDLLPVPIAVGFVPGAAGTIGARQVMESDPDGYSLLIWHVAANAAKAMGNVDFGPESFEIVAGTNRRCIMIVVREDSEYQTLPDLLNAARDNPETIISADNLGGANHIASVIAEQAVPGAAFRHVQVGGASKTYPALLGGHAEVTALTVSALSNTAANGLRLLGYLGSERHPNYPDVPTFQEQGYDSEFCIHDWYFMPPGTPADRVEVVQGAMEAAMKTEYLKEQSALSGVEHVIITGDELDALMATEVELISGIAARLRGEE